MVPIPNPKGTQSFVYVLFKKLKKICKSSQSNYKLKLNDRKIYKIYSSL